VGRETFYGFLASLRGRLFRDEDFVVFYSPDNGRASVPPSLLTTALLLQTYERVSDEEAKARADFDLRWKVALGIGIEDRPFAKSTLQLFRSHLVLHDQIRAVFQKSLALARETGYLKKWKIKAVLDTSYILGRGAVKDTYNLLADGVVQLVRGLAGAQGIEPAAWAAAHQLSRYFGTSLKGEAAIGLGRSRSAAPFAREHGGRRRWVAGGDPSRPGGYGPGRCSAPASPRGGGPAGPIAVAGH
jgi:transposase